VSRREQINMSREEIAAFLDQQRVLICATNGSGGWPHLMPLWYVIRDQELWSWTYAKSQKVKNLERDPRATLQIEDGEQYAELRGVMVQARTEIHRDVEFVAEFGAELFGRYGGGGAGPEFLEAVRAQAAKRVALQFRAERTASWDHRKLGGTY
jgi:PPOX class probable F420-dependent enzyme